MLGRRRPLAAGVGLYTAVSLCSAAAPSVWALAGLRLVQGAAGAAGIVIARAAARDRFEGAELARFFAVMMAVTGLAPILAPVLGGQLLHVTSWRGVFVGLAAVGAAILAAATAWLPESLPPERRREGGLRATFAAFELLAHDRVFAGCALSCGLAFGAMFAYIAGSPFVLQDVFGVSPQLFSAVFAVNAAGIVACSRLGARLAARVGTRRLLGAGLCACAAGGALLLAAVLARLGLWGILPALYVVVASIGLVLPNATATALAGHAAVAGSASGLLGVTQFVVGAAAAPLVGVAGTRTAVPMAIVVAALAGSALAVFLALVRRG